MKAPAWHSTRPHTAPLFLYSSRVEMRPFCQNPTGT